MWSWGRRGFACCPRHGVGVWGHRVAPPREPFVPLLEVSGQPIHVVDRGAGVLDQLGIAQATIVGASLGGYLAMALLRHHRARVAQLVLVGTRARADELATIQRRTSQQDELWAGSEVGSLAKGMVEGLLSGDSMGRTELVEYVHALAEGGAPAGWIAALEAMKGRPDSMLLLRQADVRSLVVVGELDRVTPIAEAMSLRSLLKGDLVVVPNVGHLPNLEDPLAFNDALVAFLESSK